MINKKNLIIYVLSVITLISFIGVLSSTPGFLAIVCYCLGMTTIITTKKQEDE
jgi:hypothetical protein